MPSSAPFPVATMTAVGTARPMAHGHAMISTATAAVKARTAGAVTPLTLPATNQTTNVAIASDITTGTKMPLTRSARPWMGARVPCASRINLTICASVLSAPSVVAR